MGELTVLQSQQQSGLVQFEGITVQDMALKLADMKSKIGLVQQFFKEVMEKDVDYGIVPGTQKPALFQPGADKLCALYNLSKLIVDKVENKDYKTGHYDVTVKVRLVHRGTQIVAGEGEGSCNTYESKYRYRWVYERDIPRGVDKDTLVFKEYKKDDGSVFYKYRLDNEDLFSQWNTVLKMAVKRAYVAAVLSSTGLSGLFSQEEDELDAWVDGEEGSASQSRGSYGRQQQRQSQNRNGNTGNRSGGQKPASEKQVGALFGIGKRHNLTSDDVKDIVMQKTGKDIDNLTMAEASALIDWMGKADTNDLLSMLDQSGVDDFNPDDIPSDLFSGQGGR